MSWLKDRFKQLGNIRLDSHTFGNVLKNVSPVASLAVGGPLGLGLSAALGAGGEAARGKTGWKNLLTAGAENAAAGSGLRSLASMGSHALTSAPPTVPAGPAVPGAAQAATPVIPSPATALSRASIGGPGGAFSPSPSLFPSAAPAIGSGAGSVASGVPAIGAAVSEAAQPSLLRQAGSYALQHPEVPLTAASGLAGGINQGRELDMQANQANRQNSISDEERKNRAALLASIFAHLNAAPAH